MIDEQSFTRVTSEGNELVFEFEAYDTDRDPQLDHRLSDLIHDIVKIDGVGLETYFVTMTRRLHVEVKDGYDNQAVAFEVVRAIVDWCEEHASVAV